MLGEEDVPLFGVLVLVVELPLDGLAVGALVPELDVMVEVRVEVEVMVVVDSGGAGVLVSVLFVVVERQVDVEVIVVVDSGGGMLEDVGERDELEFRYEVVLEKELLHVDDTSGGLEKELLHVDDTSGGLDSELEKLDSGEELIPVGVLEGIHEDQSLVGGGEKLVLGGRDSVGLELVEHVVSETDDSKLEHEAVKSVSVIVSVTSSVFVDVSM